MSDPNQAVLDALRQHRDRSALLVAAYDAAPARDRRRVTIGQWFCSTRHCPLLVVWQSPAGRLARLVPYKLSRLLNEQTSTPSARAKNTSDGDRHWKGAVVFVDELWPEVSLPMNCDHRREVIGTPDLLAALKGATPQKPVVVRVGVSATGESG